MKYLNLFKIIAIAAIMVFTVAGCTRTYVRPAYYYPPGNAATDVAAVSFINASPDAPALNLYLDKNMVGGSYRYADHSNYFYAYTGTRTASVYESSTQEYSANIVLTRDKYYSLFLAGKIASPEYVLLEDSLTRPAIGKTNVRFVNMSLGSGSLDLVANGTLLVNGRTYKQNSGYVAVAGDTKYIFTIRDHGSTVDKVTLPETTLAAGHSYTIWAKGVYTDPGVTGLGGEIMTNY
ncbi:MAG: DUF4397 domain-containing protein [Mucilaginibacter sp.]